MGPLLPIAAVALGNMVSGALNNSAAADRNKEDREWQEKMYGIQRTDALTDRDFQNNYNSPAAQMERLKAAGLNPNLVYGNGATTEGATTRASTVGSYNPEKMNYDHVGRTLGNSLETYLDAQLKTAQTDNLTAQSKVAAQNELLTAAQIAKTGADTAKTQQDTATGRFQLGQSQELAQTVIEQAKQNLRNTQLTASQIDASTSKTLADTSFTLSQNERNQLLTAQSLAKGIYEVGLIRANTATTQAQKDHLRQQIENLKKDGTLKKLEIKLREKGVQPHDSVITRTIADLLSGSNWKDKIEDFIKAPFTKGAFKNLRFRTR